MTHTTTVADTTVHGQPGGYGLYGHGTWRITCTCGYRTATSYGGKSAADMAARDHVAHAAGSHARRVHGCRECPL